MPTNPNIDDRLLAQAQKLGGFRTKRETVNEALRLLIQRKSLRGIEKHFGTFELREDFNAEVDRQIAKSARLTRLVGSPGPKKKRSR